MPVDLAAERADRIHAIHYDTDSESGHIEYMRSPNGNKRRNEKLNANFHSTAMRYEAKWQEGMDAIQAHLARDREQVFESAMKHLRDSL